MGMNDADLALASSPILPKTRELFVASSLEELQEKADQKVTIIPSGRDHMFYSGRLATVMKEANKYNECGDQENAYIFFCMCAQIIKLGMDSKNPKNDAKYFKAKYGTEFKRCILLAERLFDDLKLRYQRKQRLASNSASNGVDLNQLNDSSNSVNSNHINNSLAQSDKVDSSPGYKFITSKELYNLCQTKQGFVVIISLRAQSDHQSHRMHKLPDGVAIVQINSHLIHSYPSKVGLAEHLDFESRNSLSNLKRAAHIVLMDESSDHLTDDSPLIHLYNIFYKFVQDNDKPPVQAVFLKGGFQDWAITYTSFTTKSPLNTTPVIQNGISNGNNAPIPSTNHSPAHSESFSTSNLQIKRDSNTLTNGIASSKSPSFVDHSPVNHEFTNSVKPPQPSSQDRENQKPSWNKSFPGGAVSIDESRTVNKPIPIIPDRSTKPNVPMKMTTDVVHPNDKLDNNQLRPMDTNDAEDIDVEMDELNLRESSKKWRGGSIVGPSSVPSASTLRMQENNFGKRTPFTSIPRNTDRTFSESKNFEYNAPSGGGLTRSYSTPDIHGMIDIPKKQQHQQPTIDRSIKPSSLLPGESSFLEPTAKFACYTGLKNLGNTCFMNSVIQCLANCSRFALYFVNCDYRHHVVKDSKFGSNGELPIHLSQLFRSMNATNPFSSVSPSNFRKLVTVHMPLFSPGTQHDAHEFFTMLIEKLHADLNQAVKDPNYQATLDALKQANNNSNSNEPQQQLDTRIAFKKFYSQHTSINRSICSELFEGILLSTLECTVCRTKSDTFEVFTCLSLPIPNDSSVKLVDCWNVFAADEKMSGDASWDCTVCKAKREATKRIKICRLPSVLVIHLKRFSYRGVWREKLNTNVDYPFRIEDLTPFLFVGTTSQKYELTGIVNHMGTMDGGHYTAHCKNPKDGQWYKFNDQDVSKLDPGAVRTPLAGYVLFYQVI